MDLSPISDALVFSFALIIVLVFAAGFAAVIYFLLSKKLDRNEAIKVSNESGDDVGGVPFFIKRSRYLHETSYRETIVMVALTVLTVQYDSSEERASTSVQFADWKNVPWSGSTASQLEAIRAGLIVARQHDDPLHQQEAWAKVKGIYAGLPIYSGQIPTDGLWLTGNIIREEPYVDYKSTYYLNASQPLVGAADIGTELSSDGTLAKTNAKIEDNTFGQLFSSFPYSELLETSAQLVKKRKLPASGGAQYASGSDGPDNTKRVRLEFDLRQSYRYIDHIFFKDVEERQYQLPIEPSLDGKQVWYRREYVDALQQSDVGDTAELFDNRSSPKSG